MGQPKEWLLAEGEFVLIRVARVLGEVAERVVVAAREGQELPPLPEGMEIVRDRLIDAGPLAGLAAGMEALKEQCDAVIVTPCDHPELRAAFLRRLIAELKDAPAVVPKLGDRWFPLLGAYRLTVLPKLMQTLERGECRATEFARRCGAKILDAERLREVDPESESLRNVNTEEEWRSLRDG